MSGKLKLIIISGILILLIVSVIVYLNVRTKTFIVTFDSGDGVVTEVIIEENSLVTEPKNPEKEGYDFLEWQYNDEKFDFNTKINKDILLKASWKEKNPYAGLYIEQTTGSVPSELTLHNDYTFDMTINICVSMASITGTYEHKDNSIILSFEPYQYEGFAGDTDTSYEFMIATENVLKFQSEQPSCGPYKSNSFVKQ